MNQYKIAFDLMDWETPSLGVQQKIITDNKKRIRILRFSDKFIEKDWCSNGHMGYILEGEMTIEFIDKSELFRKGDGLWIKEGEKFKHKASISKGKFVELVLFEEIINE